MKVADIKLSWKRSPSSDIKSVKVVFSANGSETTVDTESPDVQELAVTVSANSNCSFKIVTTDNEGLVATSEVYSFNLGDLEAPLPATNLSHVVVAIRDIPNPA